MTPLFFPSPLSQPMPDIAPDSAEPATLPVRPLLHGVDVSYVQPHVDWPAVAASGMSFAYLKTSQRKADPLFASHWNGARAAGLKVGCYHYLDRGVPVAEQVELFLETYRGVDGWADLPPTLDVEDAGRGEMPAALVARVLAWLRAVEEGLGTRPLIYTFPAFALSRLRCPEAVELAVYPLWVAHWDVAAPTVPAPWTRHAVWQHSAKGSVDGIRGHVDIDVMRADALGLAAKSGG